VLDAGQEFTLAVVNEFIMLFHGILFQISCSFDACFPATGAGVCQAIY
jgi:hypothetical protein